MLKYILPITLFAFSIGASLAMACDDLSGTYESTDSNIGKRIYTVTQNGCQYHLQLNNAGTNVDPDDVRADNVAYDRSQSNFSAQGHVINPFLAVSDKSTGFVRTSGGGSSLVKSELLAWGATPLSQCKEQFGPQPDGCNYLQIVLSKGQNNTLLETQNGYYYSEGNMIPIYIHYKKVN